MTRLGYTRGIRHEFAEIIKCFNLTVPVTYIAIQA